MWIDTHAHLYDLSDQELSVVLDEARQKSIALIINTATDLKNSQTVLNQNSLSPILFAALGISPFDICNLPVDWLDRLEAFHNHYKVCAVGEIGIDSSNPNYPSLDHQIPILEAQLDLARRLNKTAIVHSRGAEAQAVSICKVSGITNVVFHCFTGDYDACVKVLDAGFYISFSGIVTFKNASIRSLVKNIPADRLVIETDTPYLAPVPFRGQKNRPSLVSYIGEEVAKLKGLDSLAFQEQLKENCIRLFRFTAADFQ